MFSQWRDFKSYHKRTKERNYNLEDLALFSHLKLLMNLWRALILALDTEFNLLRAGQLQRRCSIVSNPYFITTYLAIVRLESVRQRPNLPL